MPNPFRLRLNFRPGSLKNSQKILRIGDRTIIRASDKSMRQKRDIATLARAALGVCDIPYPDESMELTIVHDVDTDSVDITCRPIAEKLKRGRTGRKSDATNIVDCIADALQGVLYSNDNQIGRVVIERRVGGVIR